MTVRALRLIFVLTGTVGCASEWTVDTGSAGARDALSNCDDDQCIDTDTVPGVDAVCPEDRWVVFEDPGPKPCDEIHGAGGVWVGGAEFTGGFVPKELQNYCVYEWDSTGALPDTSALKSANNVLEAARDCVAISAQARRADYEDALLEGYREQVDGLARSPHVKQEKVDPVRVAVVDSSPDGYGGGLPMRGRFDHGFNVGSVTRSIACPEGLKQCPVVLTHHLALPMLSDGSSDWVNGGYVGRPSHLARAIYHALNMDAPEHRLILNLSVGWDGRWGGALLGKNGDELGAALASIYRALEVASCRGALIVAAAGNADLGPAPGTGPLYPAAWESADAPGPERCEKLEVPTDSDRDGPLVYSVHGVDGRDKPISITRKGGRSRLAAAGQHALAIEASGGATTPVTGSSVAAAVMSGVGALVWSQRPKLSAYELSKIIYESATPLEEYSDYGHPKADPKIRRIQACAALEYACQSGACPAGDSYECMKRDAYNAINFALPQGTLGRVAASAT
ncbi:MAG: S8/S53 family peptidase, partial [Myxococcota bacterium]